MRVPQGALWVHSPRYGVLEIVAEPGASYAWGVECWDGKEIAAYVTGTLEPLTTAAAKMLSDTSFFKFMRWVNR